jgi:prophage antirepressor-like protein
MKNTLAQFMFQSNEVRVLIKEGELWFVLKDLCDILEIINQTDILDRLDTDERGVDSILTLGGMQSMSIVSESGMYETIFSSRKPEARAFKRWVRKEVLPSIRRKGSYTLPTTPQPNIAALEKSAYYVKAFTSIEESKLPKPVKAALTESLKFDLREDKLKQEVNYSSWQNGEILADFLYTLETLKEEGAIGAWNYQKVSKTDQQKVLRHYVGVILLKNDGGVWGELLKKIPHPTYEYYHLKEYVQLLGGGYSTLEFEQSRTSHRIVKKDCLLIPVSVDYSQSLLPSANPFALPPVP